VDSGFTGISFLELAEEERLMQTPLKFEFQRLKSITKVDNDIDTDTYSITPAAATVKPAMTIWVSKGMGN
jgi:hypothetical protein